MEFLLVAFAGGLLGSWWMDLVDDWNKRTTGIHSGVTAALIGRWVLGWGRLRFAHSEITESPAREGEARAGMVFHYLVGGGCVALVYPLFFLATGIPTPSSHIVPAIVYGFITSLLPWFILFPAFGWGVFARRPLPGTRPVLASTITHLPYGLGIGVTLDGYAWLTGAGF
ncbi:DUF2938 family protein [Ectothiorhodospiraceae bacterium 2226]|nr:DUF2938 family protein [Ectothiorhodospiraceae bacterium 2226]